MRCRITMPLFTVTFAVVATTAGEGYGSSSMRKPDSSLHRRMGLDLVKMRGDSIFGVGFARDGERDREVASLALRRMRAGRLCRTTHVAVRSRSGHALRCRAKNARPHQDPTLPCVSQCRSRRHVFERSRQRRRRRLRCSIVPTMRESVSIVSSDCPKNETSLSVAKENQNGGK